MNNGKEKEENKNIRHLQPKMEKRRYSGNTKTKLHKGEQKWDGNSRIRYTDLFGGVGGFRLGIERAWKSKSLREDSGQKGSKFNTSLSKNQQCSPHCVLYSDNDKYAVQTYNKNFGENHKPTDIREIKTDSFPDIDMLCGGFPCQSFSIAGKRRGFEDTRGTLFFEIARIIKAKRPKIVFLENVKGLLNHEQGKTFRTIIQTISELGYDVQWMVLNSKFFGVPQNRERVFIIGSLRGTSRPEILPFRYNYHKINDEYKETRQIIQVDDVARENKHKLGDRLKMDGATFTLNSIEQRGIIHNIYGGFGEGVRIKDLSPTIRTPKGGGHLPCVIQPAQLVNKNRAKKPYNPNDREMKIKVRDDETSYTVKSATHEFMVKENMKIRRLTPIECERLQGFPDGWTEGVSDTQRYKQMGNAVTVNVIQVIASKLLTHLENKKNG